MSLVDNPTAAGECSCSVHGRVKPYGLNEAARVLGVSAPTLHRAVKRAEVPHTRIGSRVLIPASFVLKAVLGPDAQS